MLDLFGNHIVGFPTIRLIFNRLLIVYLNTDIMSLEIPVHLRYLMTDCIV